MKRSAVLALLALSACSMPEGPLELDLELFVGPPPEDMVMKLEGHEERLMTMRRDALIPLEYPQLPLGGDPVPRDLSQWHATVISNAAPDTLRVLRSSSKARVAALKTRIESMPVSYERREQKLKLESALRLEEQKLEAIESELSLRG